MKPGDIIHVSPRSGDTFFGTHVVEGFSRDGHDVRVIRSEHVLDAIQCGFDGYVPRSRCEVVAECDPAVTLLALWFAWGLS